MNSSVTIKIDNDVVWFVKKQSNEGTPRDKVMRFERRRAFNGTIFANGRV